MELTTKARMADQARTFAQSYQLVVHDNVFYLPTEFKSRIPGPCAKESMIWVPIGREEVRRYANTHSNILFAAESELSNFELLLKQLSREVIKPTKDLLINTEDGLRVLTQDGDLVDPDGEFRPNFIRPTLNTDPVSKAEVFNVIRNWLDSEEEAHSLLYHLATALAPGWSAVKYLLLIGEGRNGKSVLLSMLKDLFGEENVSSVTRQQMAERSPVCHELNGKLLNMIFDGEMAYVKDSSMEKTLTAGEPGQVKLLYQSGLTKVQTNALFLEALNHEPKTRDKSSALQKRLARFKFPNVFARDIAFEKMMRSEPMLGAFLALMLDHFVKEGELTEKLALTKVSLEMQVEQNLVNSPVFQFVSHLVSNRPETITELELGGLLVDRLVESFMAWRLAEGFMELSTADVKRMFKEAFPTKWKSVRDGGKVSSLLILDGVKPDMQALLDQLKGQEEDAVQPEALVED